MKRAVFVCGAVCCCLVAALAYVTAAADVSEDTRRYILYFQEQGANVPPWFLERLATAGMSDVYNIAYDVSNPFYLRGDWDGDGQADLAVRVRHRASGDTRIAFARRAAASIDMLSEGDWTSTFVWRVHARGERIGHGVGGDPPVLQGEAVYLEKPEAASLILYWNGARLLRYQLGD